MNHIIMNIIRRTARRLSHAMGAGLAAGLLAAAPASALNIVVTNDDGITSAGIQALKNALLAAGHNVVLTAPADQQSGSSAALNLEGLLVIAVAPQEFAIARLDAPAEGAEPATSALVGISIGSGVFGGAPDLLISGINDGANIGAATQLSGTVGATIAAIASGVGAVRLPAVGISTDERCDPEDPDPLTPEECEALNAQHFDEVAAFVTGLVSRLEGKRGRSNSFDGLLPPGVALNVNYPPLPPDELLGAKIVEQGKDLVLGGTRLDLTYECVAACGAPNQVFAPVVGNPQEGSDSPRTDTAAFLDGYISIVPIEASYTASPSNLRSTKSLLGDLATQ